MNNQSRRDFIRKLLQAGAATVTGSLMYPSISLARSNAHVVIIGGGFGGSVCAKYIRIFDPSIKVTLVEPSKQFITCPFSNTVLTGLNKMGFITHSYDKLAAKHNIDLVHDKASDIDPVNRKITLQGGKTLQYDKLVVSPGIDFRQIITGYDENVMPHAWKPGAQTTLLSKQLASMKKGGVFIIATPPEPFRGPPAPYERASLVAHYLKKNKPGSKILIVDSNGHFAKQELFMQGWEELYPGMIEWVKDSPISRVDNKSMTLFSSSGQSFKGDVINVIPPQQAGAILHKSGLVGSNGWCDINQKTFESSKHKDIHIIGDSAIAGDMPKTGHSANSQAKICAAAIVSSLGGKVMPEPVYSTSIYSLIGPKYAVSLAAVYRFTDGKIRQVSSGHSEIDANKRFRLKEAKYAEGWYKSITDDMFS